ncbi:MAG: ArsR family transcriptional regulator [Candidatus Thorarchaeota archaeon]|nr:MAG: ArsR family transcriptional regulator [Candidatus Thorarchaeota archaeon]
MGDDSITSEITDSLEGIVLTKEGKVPQKEIIFVMDADRASVLDEPVRLHILQILRSGIKDTITSKKKDENGDTIIRVRDVKRDALSVLEIVKLSVDCCGPDVEISKNQVYHHLPKLEEEGYVVKYGTVTTGKRTTDYWRRTAQGFVLTAGEWIGGSGTLAKKMTPFVEKMLETFDLKVPEKERKELIELMTKRTVKKAEWRTKIAELVKGDVADKMVLDQYETLVDYYAMGFKEYVDTVMRIREILFPDEPSI